MLVKTAARESGLDAHCETRITMCVSKQSGSPCTRSIGRLLVVGRSILENEIEVATHFRTMIQAAIVDENILDRT